MHMRMTMLRPSTKGRRRAALALLLLAGCGMDAEGAAAEQTSQYMLPQASGVHLGMNWGELQRARPGVRNHEGLLSESDSIGTNEYLFRQSGREPQLGSTRGSLAIVRMRPRLVSADSVEVVRTIEQIKSRWTRLVGALPVSSTREVPARGAIPARSYHVLTWSPPGATLTLEYSVGQVPPGGPNILASVGIP